MATSQKQNVKKNEATNEKSIVPASQPNADTASKLAMTQTESIPDYLKDYKGKHDGLEGTDQSDFIIPRLGLCQSLTPQRKKGDPKYIQGLEEGQFFNTVTGENYGEEVFLIPLFVAKNRIKFLEPIGSGIDCMAPDAQHGTKYGECAKCKFAQFQDGEPPECTEFKGWVSLVKGQPIGITMKATGLKVARQLNSMIRMKNLPGYCQVFRATSVDETRNNNTYKQWVIAPAGFTPPQFVESAKEYFEALRAKGVQIDTSGEEGDGFEGEGGDSDFDTHKM